MSQQLFIDMREPSDFARSHVKGAINLPPRDLMAGADQLKDIHKDTPLVLYCISGARSNASMFILRQMGFRDLTNGINQQQVEARYGV